MLDMTKYIGIPFEDHGRSLKGADCFGLVVMVYKEFMSIELPDVADGYDQAVAKAQVENCVVEFGEYPFCQDVTDKERRFLDVLVFTIGGFDCHVALHLGNNEMLHLVRGCNSVIERYDTSKWKNRLSKVYRYAN